MDPRSILEDWSGDRGVLVQPARGKKGQGEWSSQIGILTVYCHSGVEHLQIRMWLLQSTGDDVHTSNAEQSHSLFFSICFSVSRWRARKEPSCSPLSWVWLGTWGLGPWRRMPCLTFVYICSFEPKTNSSFEGLFLMICRHASCCWLQMDWISSELWLHLSTSTNEWMDGNAEG